MTKEELKKYKENKEVKFIYKLPCSLYDEGYEYIIIGDNLSSNDSNIRIFNLADWFAQIKSGSLLPYVCSILPKSGKIKEYINLYEKPNIINLRKYITDQLSVHNIDNLDKSLIQECLWGIQVIKEFKVNRIDVFKGNVDNPLSEFMETSAPIYKMWVEKHNE